MKTIFHVSIFCLAFLLASSLPLIFDDSSTSFEIKSARDKFELQLSMVIKGGDGSEFKLFSEALSPEHKVHEIKLENKQIKIEPQMDKQAILFSEYSKDKYKFGFRHEIGKKTMHFLPIRIQHQNQKHDLFLTTFDLSLPFLHESSFYRCDQVLISVQFRKNRYSSEGQIVEITLFTKDRVENNFFIQGKWDRTWRHYDDGVYFGGSYRKSNINDEIKIHLSSKKICKFSIDQLPSPGDSVDRKKYYQIKDLLKWAPQLPVSFINDEL